MAAPLRIAVLASGRGSNLKALIDARDAGLFAAEFVLVAGDQPRAGALRVAAAAGISARALEPRAYPDRTAFDRALLGLAAASGAELLVLAGYMRILDAAALVPWVGRMINIHPSLLPKYRGLHTHRRALAAGDAEHGASVHYVTAELDGGPVVAQARIAIRPGDDEASLAARLLAREHQLLPAVVAAIAQGRLRLEDERAVYDGLSLAAPLRWQDGRLLP